LRQYSRRIGGATDVREPWCVMPIVLFRLTAARRNRRRRSPKRRRYGQGPGRVLGKHNGQAVCAKAEGRRSRQPPRGRRRRPHRGAAASRQHAPAISDDSFAGGFARATHGRASRLGRALPLVTVAANPASSSWHYTRATEKGARKRCGCGT